VFLLTYLFGVVPDIESILRLTNQHDVLLVEDFSQCLNGSFDDKKVGSFGDASILSTSAVKTLDTYGGGLLFTNDANLHSKIRAIQISLPKPSLGMDLKKVTISFIKNTLTSRLLFLFISPIVFYLTRRESSKFLRFVGMRSKLPIEILPKEWFTKLASWQAVCGLRYVARVNETDRQRRSIAQKYGRVAPFVGSDLQENKNSVYWQCIVRSSNPRRARRELAKFGIDSAQTSLILLSELTSYGCDLSYLTPGARDLYYSGVYVPIYQQLTPAEIKRVCEALAHLRALDLI
jgi:dTDP-4-amino-4,6-dideoxygalactose transaminase